MKNYRIDNIPHSTRHLVLCNDSRKRSESVKISEPLLCTRSPYCLTKYALEGFHDVLRYEMRAFGVNVSISKFVTFICFKRNFKSRNSFDLSHLRWAFLNQATLLLGQISSTKPLSIVKYVGDHCCLMTLSDLILWRLNVGPTLLISIIFDSIISRLSWCGGQWTRRWRRPMEKATSIKK